MTPDVPDPGGGIPGVGWALEGITADTKGYVECTGHQDSQCGTEPQHSQSPPCEAPEVGQCQAGEGEDSSHPSRTQGSRGIVDSAVTPPKVGKGQKKAGKSGRSSTAEKTAIIPAGQEATASPIVAAQEASASPSVAAQEATASPIVAAQEGPASPIVAAQEGPASHSPAAQEGPPATAQLPRRAQPATAQLPNKGPPSQAPLNRASTAKSSTAEQGKARQVKHS
ncbi:hypothetical protein NDU88_009767 [Pleurodeles waltl]|uniref:Uncharacterized protein n=1 Tax=Pleurodeles waltl TaxID=8319 RepID=A0AAV7RZ91_PLEWA|nr:hypothetical protein NDU88_009767 [Pleurodeles waltl]